jgi:hypothetical protein
MNAENITVGMLLIPNDSRQSVENRMASAIRCIGINEQGYRFRRMNLHYNGEEFFLNRQSLEQSHWMHPPNNMQERFA